MDKNEVKPADDVHDVTSQELPKSNEDSGKLSVQKVAEIAAAAHRGDGEEEGPDDDTHTDLLPIMKKQPSFMRKGSFRRLPLQRAASLRSSGPLTAMGSNSLTAAKSSQSLSTAMASGRTLPTTTKSTNALLAVGEGGLPVSKGSMPPMYRTSSSRNLPRAMNPPRTTLRSSSTRNLLRSNSMRVPRRAPPGRSVSTDSLRAFRKDQLSNVPIESKERPGFDSKDSTRSLLRKYSAPLDEHSVETTSDLESLFTTDSINLRKIQMIADPVEDCGYDEEASYADHDSVYQSLSHSVHPSDNEVEYVEYLPQGYGGGFDLNSVSEGTFCTLDSLALQKMQIHHVVDEAGEDVSVFSPDSFSTLASGDQLSQEDFADYDSHD